MSESRIAVYGLRRGYTDEDTGAVYPDALEQLTVTRGALIVAISDLNIQTISTETTTQYPWGGAAFDYVSYYANDADSTISSDPRYFINTDDLLPAPSRNYGNGQIADQTNEVDDETTELSLVGVQASYKAKAATIVIQSNVTGTYELAFIIQMAVANVDADARDWVDLLTTEAITDAGTFILSLGDVENVTGRSFNCAMPAVFRVYMESEMQAGAGGTIHASVHLSGA